MIRKIGEFKRRSSVILLTAMFSLSILYLGYGFLISKNRIVLRIEEFESSKITTPLKILFLSDLHNDHSSIFQDRMIQEVASQKPDLIVMGGDMVNEDTRDFSYLYKLIDQIPDQIPVVYGLGNEERDNPELSNLIRELEKRNVLCLDLSFADLLLKGQIIRIGGMYDYSFALDGEASPDPKQQSPEISEFLDCFQDSTDLKIMVHHRPDSFIFSAQPDYWNIDFTLAGHTHGGQVILPLIGGLWAPDQGWFPKYIHGKYEMGALTTFITSGVSTGDEFLWRFNNPMEIMLINIYPKNSI